MSALTRLAICLCGLVAVLFFSASSFAAFTVPTGVEYCATRDCGGDKWNGVYQYFNTPQAAGEFRVSIDAVTNGLALRTLTCTATSCHADYYRISDGYEWVDADFVVTQRTISSCPANSTGTTSCTCNSGYDQVGSACVPHTNKCTATQGAIKTINNTIGYSTDSTDDPELQSVVGSLTLPPASVCSGGCEWDSVNTPSIPPNGYISQSPTSQGLYRVSVDTSYRQSATECSVTTSSADTKAVPPSCPGYVGQVNGKTVCAMPKGVSTGDKVPAAAVGNNLNPGNPAAGVKPDTGSGSGSGSGRTPTEGTGGADGGPIGSTVKDGAGSSTGTVTKPADGTEQQACGAPGQPVCAVTLDEKGTPKGLDDQKLGVFDDAKKSFDDAIVGITGTSGKDTSWGVVPSWFTPGACAPVNLWTLPEKLGSRQIVLDLCPVMDEIHLLTNFLWVVATFFLTINMVRETVTKGK